MSPAARQRPAPGRRAPQAPADSLVGTTLELEVGPVAHGGACVARHEGRVVFVRHAVPGERVRARVTDGGAGSRFLRADAVEVLSASPDRVEPPCPWAGPGRCGGCDWQHVALPVQRELKAAVVREQLARLAGLDLPVTVEAVPGDTDGLGWRTRVRFAVDAEARLALRKHRSHELVAVDRCRIAAPGVDEVHATEARWPGAGEVEVVASAGGDRTVLVSPAQGAHVKLPKVPAASSVLLEGAERPVRGRAWVREQVAGADWRVAAAGFWQVHPGAVDALVAAVLEGAQPAPGETALDLYAGAGVFAGVLAERVGVTGTVVAVEGDRRAASDARRNLHGYSHVRIETGPVDRVLRAGVGVERADVVVLDPPRDGAGPQVVVGIAALAPRVVAYVACDPAPLARDLRHFAAAGYAVRTLRAFDLFPMTQHVECVAVLDRVEQPA
ncbi:tRNA/tmRNA/rRNA uracil-C5-methylase (TrmA/RlmC/RlmD family) [Motilibacter peucedani]|uniref:tRNA/tmRNA/rRNA uracil-C5-methylase (TrmA/RlmC/RlmD family) n=1 Tax=Motilibacter peucedani TaxID=598650 RepID=A0A420XS47_9ACTN|nr:TRAM domain-containing protein [Motilibacter peucedani]RKS77639.1 tRNA/tmRNA/rRNA uracil-C5-methylase (TrmA/RlmC/RlmD family) [Motilibacter peucedani]